MDSINYTPRTPFDPSSESEDVYIEQLNEVSELLGGVRNIGAYAQITGIEHTTCISTEKEERYVHIDTKLANRYYKASMNYLRKALYGADLAPFEKRWKKIMQEAKPEKNYKADSRVIALLKAKIQQNGELLRWIE